MYGVRARIGLLVPAINGIVEPEFNAMKPEGVSVHATRLPYEGTFEGLESMATGIEDAAKLLVTGGVSVIAYACTAGSLVKGAGWDQELIKRIEAATGLPATTTSTAVIKALKEFGVRKVAVATPYGEDFNRVEKQFFEAHGIKVLRIKGLDIHGEVLRSTPIETAYNLAREVNMPEADAVFISCTGFKSITVIEKLEKELRKPVFSSNTATMWDVLKKLGIKDPIRGYGKLFER